MDLSSETPPGPPHLSDSGRTAWVLATVAVILAMVAYCAVMYWPQRPVVEPPESESVEEAAEPAR